MAVLTFTQQGNMFVAEFTAEADFNLHIERSEQGLIQVLQRTGEDDGATRFAVVKEFPIVDMRDDEVIDESFIDAVYPKTIRVVSEVSPSFACVTFAS